ncbi:glycosyltransferase family 4 protein [Prosthecobacter sp.]|uniref:glycosyltransferase family 4 protein n=1 Tax=Prosthecobacter sp. TaxID=1965333 RepID=UPI003782DAB1
MKLIYVFPEPPLPFLGAAARLSHLLLSEAVRRGVDVEAFIEYFDEKDAAALREMFNAPNCRLRLFCAKAVPKNFIRTTRSMLWQGAFLYDGAFVAALEESMRDPEAVLHLETHSACWPGLRYLDRTVINLHYLLNADMRSEKSHGLRVKWNLYRERQMLKTFKYMAAVTPALAEDVSLINPAATIRPVQFGLDLAGYPYSELAATPDRAPNVGMIGSYGWAPTRAAARHLFHLWPLMKQSVKNARLYLVGRGANRILGDEARAADPAARVVENVPDIIPYFHDLDCMVYAPEHASGIKVKILEAFALGVPVVTNQHGIDGIPAVHREHCIVAHTNAELVAGVQFLLENPQAKTRMIQAARKLAEEICAPSHVFDQWLAFYSQMQPSKAAKPRMLAPVPLAAA